MSRERRKLQRQRRRLLDESDHLNNRRQFSTDFFVGELKAERVQEAIAARMKEIRAELEEVEAQLEAIP